MRRAGARNGWLGLDLRCRVGAMDLSRPRPYLVADDVHLADLTEGLEDAPDELIRCGFGDHPDEELVLALPLVPAAGGLEVR